MATRAGEKTSFAVACSLLSNFIKQNGAISDLSLGIAPRPQENPKGETEKPTTMSLLPGLNIPEEKEKETQEKPIMDLFPQVTGFGSSESSEHEKSQLTIFYGGKIMVFDNFPSEKAKDLLNMASKGAEPTNQTPPPVPTPSPVPVQKPTHPTVSDMPIARKASLHRFLEKRKDRINAKAPYNKALISSEKSNLGKKKEETQTWLGLNSEISQ